MELNKDIADISAAEAENFKGKRFILCYHDYNIKNFESALVQIDKITKVVGSPISIAVVPAIGAAPEEERERFCESIEKVSRYFIITFQSKHFFSPTIKSNYSFFIFLKHKTFRFIKPTYTKFINWFNYK